MARGLPFMGQKPMEPTGFSILAVESDAKRAANLKRLLQECVDADVAIATSSDGAIAKLSAHMPDLVVTSALLAPDDDAKLMAYLRDLEAARDLPVLTVLPVIDDKPAQKKTGPLAFLMRRTTPLGLSYDPKAIGSRITDALYRSRLQKRTRAGLAAGGDAGKSQLISPAVALAPSFRRAHIARRRAHRWTKADIGWLRRIETDWGLELQLLNISTTGLLVESTSKLMPETSTELRLLGHGTNVVLPARVVRSEVAQVNNRGVRYHAAAVFDRKFELLPDRPGSSGTATPKALAELLMRVTTELGRAPRPEVLRAIYEDGLRQLVSAREVKIRAVPAQALDGSDSVYFTVPTGGHSRVVLQATFEPNYEPAEEEFRLLKAAAMVAGVVLEYESAPPPSLALVN
jgi:CheY-like chemotaxis protein